MCVRPWHIWQRVAWLPKYFSRVWHCAWDFFGNVNGQHALYARRTMEHQGSAQQSEQRSCSRERVDEVRVAPENDGILEAQHFPFSVGILDVRADVEADFFALQFGWQANFRLRSAERTAGTPHAHVSQGLVGASKCHRPNRHTRDTRFLKA